MHSALTGAPALGLPVHLYWRGTTYRDPLTATTGSDGGFILTAPAGPWALGINPSRTSGLFCWSKELNVEADTVLDVALAPGYLISGRVTDATTGEPVPPGHIRPGPGLHHIEAGGPRGDVTPRGCVPYTDEWGFLDGNGNYAVWVPAGTYTLYLLALEGWVGTTREVTVVSADVGGVDFSLRRTVRVVGQVVSKGAPLAGVEVHLCCVSLGDGSTPTRLEAFADAAGFFVFDDVPVGSYYVAVVGSSRGCSDRLIDVTVPANDLTMQPIDMTDRCP